MRVFNEDIDNLNKVIDSKSPELNTVISVDTVTADAIQTSNKKTAEINKQLEQADKVSETEKPFIGAEKQPVPERIELEEELFEELQIITDFSSYEPWGQAVSTYVAIENADMLDAFEDMMEDAYPNGINETTLNDILAFDSDWVLSSLGISDEEANESLNEEADEAYLLTNDAILNWLSDHDQAYNDAQRFFKTDNLEEVDSDEIIDWIYDHDTLTSDFERHFKIGNINECDEQPNELVEGKDDEYDLWTLVYNELDQNLDPLDAKTRRLKGKRYKDISTDFNGNIILYAPTESDFDFAKQVANEYGVDIETNVAKNYKDENRKFIARIIIPEE